MTTFRLQVPGDERTYEIDGPEGSTAEDAMKQLRETLIKERPKESGLQDFGEGLGLSALETVYGIKDLVAGLSPEENARLEDWRQDAGQSGWGTAGNIVGDVAQYAIPGTGIVKGVGAVGKVSKLAKALQATKRARYATRGASDIVGAGIVGGLKAPDIGETRAGNIEGDIAGAVTGEMLGYGLGKAIKGINKTPAAERLLAQGVPLTPGEAAAGKFAQGLEAVGEVTPLVAHGVKRARVASEKGLQKLAMDSAAPPGLTVTKTGVEGVQQLKQGFTDAYSDAWKGATSLDHNARVGFINTLVGAAPKLTKKQKTALKGVVVDFKELTKGVTPDKLRALDNDLRKRISAAKKDYDYQELLSNLRSQIRAGAPPEVMEKLTAVDKQYGKYLVVRRAAKSALGDEGEFGGKQLINAVKAIGKDQVGEGTAPLSQLAMDAGQTTERNIGGQPLEWFRRIAGITPTPFPMQAAGRVVLGQTGLQKAAQKAAEKIPETIRRPGPVGAAADFDERDFWKYWK